MVEPCASQVAKWFIGFLHVYAKKVFFVSCVVKKVTTHVSPSFEDGFA
jgi:hypothetical protein